MTTETAPQVYTIEEVAALLRVNPMTVRRLLKRGEMEGYQVGTAWRIPARAVAPFLDQQSGGARDSASGKS